MRTSVVDLTEYSSVFEALRSLEKRGSSIMSDPIDTLILDLLEWIGPGARPYAEVMEAWRTSCPRLPVWEEANLRGFVGQRHEPGQAAAVILTALGKQHLELARKSRASAGGY